MVHQAFRGLRGFRGWGTWLLAGVLGLAAGWGLYRVLAWGPWAFTDSVAYVDAARGVLAGRGLVVRESPSQAVPLAHYPPLYPLLLAAAMAVGRTDWLTAARALDALWAALFVAVLAGTVVRAAPRWWLAWLVALPVLTQPTLVQHMTGVMSEPPFFVAGLGTWAAAWAYTRTGNPRWWWGAVVLAAAGVLLRYAGLYALLVLPLSLTARPWPPRVWRRRAAEAVLGLLAVYAGWNLYMRAHGNGLHFGRPDLAEMAAKARNFVLALPPVFWEGWLRWPRGVLKTWWGPVLPWALVALGALAAVLMLRAARRAPEEPAAGTGQAAALAWLFGHGYAAFFLAAYVLRRPEPDFNPRVMLPWFVFGLLAAGLSALWAVERALGRRGWPWRAGAYALLGLAVLLFAARSAKWSRAFLRVMHDRGHGFTARPWHAAQTWAFLRAWPADIPWVTNAPEPLLLWADRPAYRLAEYAQFWPPQGPLGYREAVDFRHRLFISGQAAAIYVRPEEARARRLYEHKAGAVADLLFRRYTRCYEDELIELYYLGPRAAELCPLGPSVYHHPRR